MAQRKPRELRFGPRTVLVNPTGTVDYRYELDDTHLRVASRSDVLMVKRYVLWKAEYLMRDPRTLRHLRSGTTLRYANNPIKSKHPCH